MCIQCLMFHFFPPMLCVFSLVFIVLGNLMNMDSIMAETWLVSFIDLFDESHLIQIVLLVDSVFINI